MKKSFKVLLIITIAVIMMFTITGCGKKEESSNTKEEVNVNKTNANQSNANQSNANQVNETQTNEVSKTEKTFSMGEWKNNVYTNEFLGIKLTLPEGWSYSDEEQIASMMNIGVELLNDDQKELAEISKLNTVYYVVANNAETGDNLSIMSEKPAQDVTVDYYINALKTQLTAVESLKYTINETTKATIGNNECDVLSVTAEVSGVSILQKYYVYKQDKYFVVVIATVTEEAGFKTIVDAFK